MKRARILVADDDRGMRSALRTRLKAWGYSVSESLDGLGVINQASREHVDAIILDHEMPNGDGRSIARVLRKESDVPIIFLSGHDREDFWDTVHELADVYFLPKPTDFERLRRLLESCMPSRPAKLVPA